MAEAATAAGSAALAGVTTAIRPDFPSRPCGRMTSTPSRTRNTISVDGVPGISRAPPSWKMSALVATDWMMPTSTPPRNAPGRLVMPPSTAAVNAGMR